MTATTIERLTEFYGLVPARGTYPIAANTKILKGTLVGLDSAGRAIAATTAATCVRVVGKASSTVNNLTGSELGGAAGATDLEVEHGIFNWMNSAAADEIAADDIGKLCYAVDNQTVALTSDGGTRQIAGLIVGFYYGFPQVYTSPLVPVFHDVLTDLASTANAKGASLIGIEDVGTYFTAATVEAALQEIIADLAAVTASNGANMIGFQDGGGKTLSATVDAALDELYVEATSTQGVIELPIGNFCDADGDYTKFADGGADGLTIVDAKAVALRFNNDANPPKMLTSFGIPYDANITADMTLKFLVSKTGATNNAGNTTTLVVEAFNQVAGALHDADGDYGGTTGAVVPDAPAKTTAVLSLTLALADLPAVGSGVSLTVKPTDGTLDTDDFIIHRAWVEYTRKPRTA